MTKSRISSPTVVRESPNHPGATWWVMNHREKGFSSFGYPHPSLADVLEKWAVRVTGAGVDKHGVYVEIAPL